MIEKNPLGMRDILPKEMIMRENVFNVVRNVFKYHGGVEIDTPLIELKENLIGKYGEDTKLIYDIADQGGEILALRYDLTVPLARFCMQHGITNLRRYQIGKVYRRDNPVVSKGRYREFYQCDWDCVGEYELMVPDAECIKIVVDIMSNLGIDNYLIKINNRKILDGIFEICGVDTLLFRTICSSIDKLDKCSWEIIRDEIIKKGVKEDIVDKIWEFVSRKGDIELLEDLLNTSINNNKFRSGIEELILLLNYCDIFDIPKKYLSIDLSLARGLDYYTGVIYEAVLLNESIGSIAGGGRYDNLINCKNKNIPCVGVSIGIERLLIFMNNTNNINNKKVSTDIYVISGEKNMLNHRLKICSELWKHGLNADTRHNNNSKLLSQLQYCENNNISLCIIIGTSELLDGNVKIREVKSRFEIVVSREIMVSVIKKYFETNILQN